jgi:hypothetical protein
MPRNIAWPEANSRSAFEKPEPEILLFGPNTIARLKAARLGQVHVRKIGKGNSDSSVVPYCEVFSPEVNPGRRFLRCAQDLKLEEPCGHEEPVDIPRIAADHLPLGHMLKHEAGKCEIEWQVRLPTNPFHCSDG